MVLPQVSDPRKCGMKQTPTKDKNQIISDINVLNDGVPRCYARICV